MPSNTEVFKLKFQDYYLMIYFFVVNDFCSVASSSFSLLSQSNIFSLKFTTVEDVSASNMTISTLSRLLYCFWQANSGPNTNGCQVNFSLITIFSVWLHFGVLLY